MKKDFACPEDALSVFNKWYKLDENAVDPEYVLCNLLDQDMEKEYWGTKENNYCGAYKQMLSILQGVSFDQRHPGLLVCKSVTEWEVRAAFGPYPVKLDDKKKAFFWIVSFSTFIF